MFRDLQAHQRHQAAKPYRVHQGQPVTQESRVCPAHRENEESAEIVEMLENEVLEVTKATEDQLAYQETTALEVSLDRLDPLVHRARRAITDRLVLLECKALLAHLEVL